jgi:plasmid segregation protein ParM
MTTLRDVSIGLDVGHSAVKIILKIKELPQHDSEFQFPTVIKPFKESANRANKAQSDLDRVDVGGVSYHVGETAKRESQPKEFFSQTKDWIRKVEHDALIKSGFQRAMNKLIGLDIRPNIVSLTLGLPSAYLSQGDELENRAKEILAAEKSRLGIQSLQVQVESQSRAPLFTVALDPEGKLTGRAGPGESWGVVEIGHFTTDFSLFIDGAEVESASKSTDGLHLTFASVGDALEQSGYPRQIDHIRLAIESKKTMAYGEDVNVAPLVDPIIKAFVDRLVTESENVFAAHAPSLNGIILAGGAAQIVFAGLSQKYRHTKLAANPRYQVAEGLARFGLMTLN